MAHRDPTHQMARGMGSREGRPRNPLPAPAPRPEAYSRTWKVTGRDTHTDTAWSRLSAGLNR